MTRTVYYGSTRLRIPDGWTTFVWHNRRYRVRDRIVEVETNGVWAESIILTCSAPKGRRAA